MSFYAAAQRRSTAVFLLLGALVVAGVALAARLPSAIFPAVTFPQVKIIADVGELPAARMIPTTTRPLEEAVSRVPGLEGVRSITSRGSTEMSAQFAWGTDMETARQRVEAEVARIRPDLPADVRVDVEWMNTSIFPILGYALTSETVPQWKLRELAEYRLKPTLLRVAGVSQVQVQGGRQREIQIHLDPQVLAGYGLSPADVIETVRDDHQVLSAGLVERNHELDLAVVDGRTGGLTSLADLEVAVADGPPVPLGRLGSVGPADAVSYVRTTADGNEAVLVNVVQQPSANTVDIARGIDAVLQAHPELIPPGVVWTRFYDQARFVQDSVRGVRDAMLIGVALAALVLLAFLRRGRPTVVAVLAIPATVALVLLGLRLVSQSLNLMTLGGIAAALGLVADDAIVMVENILRHADDRLSADPALHAARELLPALLGSSLSTIVVFIPFALLSGVAGAFFRPLAFTMVLALTASFALAALPIPLALRRWVRPAPPTSGEPPQAEAGSRSPRWIRRLVAA